MKTTSYYPVLMTDDVPATAAFYQEHFAFTPAFEADWYVHLTGIDDPTRNLAILDYRHETVPVAGRHPSNGVFLNFEVDDVDAEYARLRNAGVEMLLEIRDEPFGQRHFIVDGPGGVMVDVIKVIPPNAEHAENYIA